MNIFPIIFFSLIFIFILIMTYFAKKDSKNHTNRNNLIVYTDIETGVQYVSPAIGHGLCLRVDRDGKPIINLLNK